MRYVGRARCSEAELLFRAALPTLQPPTAGALGALDIIRTLSPAKALSAAAQCEVMDLPASLTPVTKLHVRTDATGTMADMALLFHRSSTPLESTIGHGPVTTAERTRLVAPEQRDLTGGD